MLNYLRTTLVKHGFGENVAFLLHFLQKHYILNGIKWILIHAYYIYKETFVQFLYIFLYIFANISLISLSSEHTDKQISVTEGRLVAGQHVFHNL